MAQIRIQAGEGSGPVIAVGQLSELLLIEGTGHQGIMPAGIGQKLLQPQFGECGDRQQQQGVADQVTDPHLQTVEAVGSVLPVGTNRRPEVTHAEHRGDLQLLLHPADVVLVITEQGNLQRGERELEPALGVGSGGPAIEEGRAGTHGQQQGGFTAQQAQTGEQGLHVRHAEIEVHAGGDHPCAVGAFNEGVVRVPGVGPLEAGAVSEAEGASREDGQPPGGQPVAQPSPWLEDQGKLAGIVPIRGRGVFQVALVRLDHEPLQLRGDLGGAADHRAVGPAGVHLHLEALEQQWRRHRARSLEWLSALCRQARALSRPRALLRVSRYSASGCESATIPAPACT